MQCRSVRAQTDTKTSSNSQQFSSRGLGGKKRQIMTENKHEKNAWTSFAGAYWGGDISCQTTLGWLCHENSPTMPNYYGFFRMTRPTPRDPVRLTPMPSDPPRPLPNRGSWRRPRRPLGPKEPSRRGAVLCLMDCSTVAM